MATEVFELMADPLLSAEKEPESKEESPLASHASSESEIESNPPSLPSDVCIKCKKRPISYKKAHLCKSCYTNLPKYLERKKKYYNSDKARTKRRLQSALDTSHTEESHSPRAGRRGNRGHMKVAVTLDNQPQQYNNPHSSVTGFQGPISGPHLDNLERTSNHILIPQTAPARMVPSISPFHVPRAPDQTYLGHALQAYTQAGGIPRDYAMHYGMFRPPTNAVSFDPMVVYKYEGAPNPTFIAPPHALATPVYAHNGNPAQIWQNADLAMIRPNPPKEKPTNGWQQNFISPLFTERYRIGLMNDGFFVADLLDPQEIEMCNEELNRLGANNIDAYSKLRQNLLGSHPSSKISQVGSNYFWPIYAVWTGCWNTKAQFYLRTHPKLYSLLASCYGNYKLVSYPEFSIRLPGEIKTEKESKSVCYAQSGIDYKQQFYKVAQGQPVDRRYTAIIALADQDHFGFHLLPGSQRAEFWVNWVRANAEELDKDKAGGCINITESRFKESEQLKSKFVPLPLKAGQVVIFDSFMAYGFTPASDAKTRNFVVVNLVECIDDKINAGELKNCEVFITNMSRLPPPVTFQHRAHSSEPSTAENVCLTYLGHAMLGDTRLYNTAEGKKILERLQSAENLDSEIKQLTHAVLDEWDRSRVVPGENNVNYNNNDNNNEILPRRISIQSVLNL